MYKLRDYQQAIVDDLKEYDNWGLFVQRGRGKTFMAMELTKDIPRVHIICRKNKLKEWKADMSYRDGVSISSFGTIPDLPAGTFIIVDESQNIKSRTTGAYKKVRKLKRKGCNIGLLTGTPQHYEYKDYYTSLYLLDIIDMSFTDYSKKYFKTVSLDATNKYGPQKIVGYHKEDELREYLQSPNIAWYHVKSEFPPVIREKLFPWYPQYHDIIKQQFYEDILFDTPGKIALFKRQMSAGILGEHILNHNKANWVVELIRLNPKLRIIVFTNWNLEIDLLSSLIKEEHNIYNGSVKEDIDKRIALVNVNAGSTGVNSFKDFDIMIFHSAPVSHIVYEQATGRIDRGDRTYSPVIYLLLTPYEKLKMKPLGIKKKLDEYYFEDSKYSQQYKEKI